MSPFRALARGWTIRPIFCAGLSVEWGFAMRKNRRPPRRGPSRLFLPVLLGLAGCTTVTVQGAADVTSSHFGILRVTANPNAPITSVHIRGFGLVPSSNGVTIGKSDEIITAVNNRNDCHAIFIVDNDAQVKNIVATFQAAKIDTASLCEVRGEKR